MELTKEYLDKQLANQFKLTKEHFDTQIKEIQHKLKTLATKQDLEDFQSKIVDTVADLVATPLTRHIAQVKKVLILPKETGKEKIEPFMVRDEPRSKIIYSSAFIEHWVERSKQEWEENKVPMARRKELLKLLLPRESQAFRNRVLRS